MWLTKSVLQEKQATKRGIDMKSSVNPKKGPEIFKDPKALRAAFNLSFPEIEGVQAAHAYNLVVELARDCDSWSSFLARVDSESRLTKDKNRLAALAYLESKAKYLEKAPW